MPCRSRLFPILIVLSFTVFSIACKPEARAVRPVNAELERVKTEANQLFFRSQYQKSAEVYRKGFALAQKIRDYRYMAWFLIGEGNCYQLQFDYRRAVALYLRARAYAHQSRDAEVISSSMASLASSYWRMGNLAAATAAFEETLNTASGTDQNPAFWLNLGVLYGQNGDFNGAKRMLWRGISEAEAKGDIFSAARGWNQLGWEHLKRNEIAEARGPIIEGFRLRKMLKSSEMAMSYRSLGLLRRAERDLPGSLRLLDESVRQGIANGSGVPIWDLYYRRGTVRLETGDLPGGLSDLETAIAFASRWRAEIVPAESLQNGATVSLHGLYDDYINVCMGQYQRTRDISWAKRAFVAADRNRALALQKKIMDRQQLSPEFWEGVSALRRTELALLKENSTDNQRAAAAARLRLMELEMAAGLASTVPKRDSHRKNEIKPPENPLLQLVEGLSAGEALISFHTGDTQSWVWALSRGHFKAYRAPGRKQLEPMIASFRQAVEQNRPDIASRGADLYSALFGELGREEWPAHSWLLVPDGPLYEVPFAALIRGGRYLAETTSIRVLTSGVPQHTPIPPATGRFVGFGDPIYNVADPRWKGPSFTPIVELTRLPGTALEIEACARAVRHGDPPVLLTGAAANRNSLLNALREPVGVLHLATHVIPRLDIPDQNWIAIGLVPESGPDFLTPVEIAASKYRIGLVAMTGCGSGTGKALPGLGLLGLARAWLAGGAGAVAASLWPVRDESGELFQRLYQHFGRPEIAAPKAAADALRRAQIEMLAAGGWKAEPRYWAAFFIAGRN